jgi:hypothetical protein
MKGMIFKKAFLIGGIFLLATFMLAQLSWGCDDDDKDKWDCDRHDKWDCHKHGERCQPPKIQRVFLEYQADSIVFEIWGKDFDKGAPPVVTLGGMYGLTVVDDLTDDNVITATLPIKGFEYGDYRLVVSTCHNSACKDRYCKDHGPNCKCKYCKDHCSKCKDKYCKDHEYKCKCKDRYSLSIPGPEGPSAKIGFEIESITVESSARENLKQFEGRVECGSGFRVTGGGFSCPTPTSDEFTECRIMVSEPLQDDKKNGIGWHVIASHVGSAVQLTIHAICAQVQ